MKNPCRITLVAFAITAAGPLTAQAAGLDHNDTFSCYVYVHEQCYPGGGQSQCDPGDYEDALDECDGYYDDAARRPAKPASFAAKTNPQVMTRIMQTFKQPR
jgi:hypothetical protein